MTKRFIRTRISISRLSVFYHISSSESSVVEHGKLRCRLISMDFLGRKGRRRKAKVKVQKHSAKSEMKMRLRRGWRG